MKNINFAIVGYGFMGHEHASMLQTMPGIKLLGVSDIDKRQFSDSDETIRCYKDNDELFSDPDVDVVIISANNNQHLNLVLQAARAGKNIICEKPVALTVDELDQMINETSKYNVEFTVHHQRRLDPDFQMIKKVYDQGLLGQVYTLKNSLYGFNGNMHDWHIYPSEGGGMLYDWGVHLIDQVLWMMPDAKIKTVFADIKNVINQEVDDYFKILLTLDNGITAEIELGTYYLTDKIEEKWFERHWIMSGNTGTAYIDGFEPSGKIVRTTRFLTNVDGKRTMTAAGPTRSFGPPQPGVLITEELPTVDTNHRGYFENYIRAYWGQERYLVNIAETRRVLRLMEVARNSAKTGCSQKFE